MLLSMRVSGADRSGLAAKAFDAKLTKQLQVALRKAEASHQEAVAEAERLVACGQQKRQQKRLSAPYAVASQ